jgi:hypothetical protein
MPQIHQVGPHATWFEEPDVIALRLDGAVSLEDSEALAQVHLGMAEGRERVFMLIDMSDFGGGTPAGRKVTSEALTRMPVRGVAVYGAKLTQKVMAKLVLVGVKLFRKEDEARFPIEFLEHEDAARDWIEARRDGAERNGALDV